jgi:hypothetical protein
MRPRQVVIAAFGTQGPPTLVGNSIVLATLKLIKSGQAAQRVGANWAAWGMVQKVSNLILNINVYMENADSGKMEFARSVDIRGNTGESWRRGLDYLLRNYLFREP